MSNVAVAQALSSEVSWRILNLLIKGELGAEEVSRSLGVELASVMLHVERLVEAGIVARKERILPSGKIAAAFSLTGSGKSVGFPPRNYLMLSEAMINSLRGSFGEDAAKMMLHDIGVRTGEEVAKALNARVGLVKWDPKTYAEQFVKGLLADLQTYPRIIKVGRRQVAYEQLNCLFEDLAIKYPGLVCDTLDEAVHEGIDKRLGGMKTIRVKCKGHGDSVCRFSVEWEPTTLGTKAGNKTQSSHPRRPMKKPPTGRRRPTS